MKKKLLVLVAFGVVVAFGYQLSEGVTPYSYEPGHEYPDTHAVEAKI
ncbi:hypothetical protein [Fredinandcohnia quinoae]|uniref:Phr family secreted Rap phosphatase inhibitor n=1 Tax=Fredinandcohnia quinoae TaxID=2918902 RepID=A0AAW5E8G9_9BACI|nr:hypothetical protein [Fredinandcohnia sp. SECRCQ15]MCH1627545.1 hypothetical protein [Fredinandcohnia sp. SECRCQ15]